MTQVEMTNVSPDGQVTKSIVTLPDRAWADMAYGAPVRTVGGITTTVSEAYGGVRVIVDAHMGGTVIVWRELPPTPTCAICDGAHRGADCTDPARMGGRVTGLPA